MGVEGVSVGVAGWCVNFNQFKSVGNSLKFMIRNHHEHVAEVSKGLSCGCVNFKNVQK